MSECHSGMHDIGYSRLSMIFWFGLLSTGVYAKSERGNGFTSGGSSWLFSVPFTVKLAPRPRGDVYSMNTIHRVILQSDCLSQLKFKFVWVKIWFLERKFATSFDSQHNCVLRTFGTFLMTYIVYLGCRRGILWFSNRPIAEHMGPEGVRNRKKTPIFFVDAK